VLHDIKNHVSGLSLVVDNARRHLANPEFQRDALAVVERTVRNLKELMSQVSGVARSPDVHPEPCDVRELLTEATMSAGLEPGARDGIELRARIARDESGIARSPAAASACSSIC
jgi:nitrogen fixation/metabolism regulation signal transduction histidine kinase